jgi:hypothetical protein
MSGSAASTNRGRLIANVYMLPPSRFPHFDRLITWLPVTQRWLPCPALTNESDENPERRRYRRWSKDEPPVRQRQNVPGSPPPDEADRLDLDALRSARHDEGLDTPLARDQYAVEYSDYGYEPEPEGALRNPYILAGLAVGAAIVLAVMVVVLFGSSGDAGPGGENQDPSLIVDSLTPQPGGANTTGRGILAKTIAASTVREGPGTDFAQIAPLPTGQDVEVAGRNGDNSWFQIYYPQGSQLKGWVPGTALRLTTENVASLAIVSSTPVPRVTVVRPTEQPAAPAVTPSVTPTAAPTGTPTPQGGGVDIAVAFQNPTCLAGSSLSLVIRNAGTAALQRSAQVVLSNASGVISTQSFGVDLPPGSAMTLLTGVAAQAPRMTAQITLLPATNQPPDGNAGNNTAECTSGAAVPPGTTVIPAGTPTPRPPTLTPVPPRIPGA